MCVQTSADVLTFEWTPVLDSVAASGPLWCECLHPQSCLHACMITSIKKKKNPWQAASSGSAVSDDCQEKPRSALISFIFNMTQHGRSEGGQEVDIRLIWLWLLGRGPLTPPNTQKRPYCWITAVAVGRIRALVRVLQCKKKKIIIIKCIHFRILEDKIPMWNFQTINMYVFEF